MKGTNQWRHRANRNRDNEIDIPDKFHVARIIKTHFGVPALTDEVLIIPSSNWPRFPDLFVKITSPQFAINLDGEGVHGYGDEISRTKRDKGSDEDYLELEPGIKLITINSAVTEGYEESLVIEALKSGGLKVLNTKVTHSN